MISMKRNRSRNRSHANPSSIKTRFTARFLLSVSRLSKKDGSKDSGSTEKQKRYRRIRAASYAFMASAVGWRRAWSQAILKKVRNRSLDRFLGRQNRSKQRKKGVSRRPKEDELRQLVPGGRRMSSTMLVRETAHYIECLRTQVQVMTSIIDWYSNSKK